MQVPHKLDERELRKEPLTRVYTRFLQIHLKVGKTSHSPPLSPPNLPKEELIAIKLTKDKDSDGALLSCWDLFLQKGTCEEQLLSSGWLGTQMAFGPGLWSYLVLSEDSGGRSSLPRSNHQRRNSLYGLN